MHSLKWKIFSSAVGFMFIVFALLQLNDPDPYIWIAFYMLAAFYSFAAAFEFLNLTAVKIFIVICIIGFSVEILSHALGWSTFENGEFAKELGGIFVGLVWARRLRFELLQPEKAN